MKHPQRTIAIGTEKLREVFGDSFRLEVTPDGFAILVHIDQDTQGKNLVTLDRSVESNLSIEQFDMLNARFERMIVASLLS